LSEVGVPPGQRARRLLTETQNLVLATVGGDGEPWVSPLFFAADGQRRLYWTSEPGARHSRNLRENPRVAIVIYDDAAGHRVDGLYLTAAARELGEPDEIVRALAVMAQKPQPERWRAAVTDVSATGPWRVYRADIFCAQLRATELVDGRPVARRVSVELEGE
jgi:nitroimidazol reductase NimA-like FMN-containing flavoprotein (pyridoxamine 5'-phosphate oxidase superfamily)